MLNATTQTDNPSLWRADPSPEGDKLWKDNWDTYPILIPFDDLAKLGQDPEYGVRWPYKGTSMTAVGSHAHHLLHCLDVLRKTVWADHYWPNGNLNPGHRTHQTHCIDILRQDLMCRAPMDVYSFIWLESEPASQPNFNISMKCGDWDGMLARWRERQLSKEEAHMDPEKPEGVKEWPAPNALKQENAALLELCNKPGVNCTIDGEPI
ncbi:hypothetical protein HBH51_065590 [Parastagonospora nodorum]|nr:hypothetical protein HBH51_065590 [Parastagonospora nodorum]